MNATFEQTFSRLTGFSPMKWQIRLFNRFIANDLPSVIDIPTGLGKTSVMAIWYTARLQTTVLPRRLIYVVDRRAVVDQATEEAERIKKNSLDNVLRISTLRGQFADNREWLSDPAANTIIVGTVDMIGSRLLFEGYGVSRRMRPYHAGLLGTDSIVVLDESHLVPPFERLLEQITQRTRTDELGPKNDMNLAQIPRLCVLPLSATARESDGDVFRITDEDRQDANAMRRLSATKRLQFKPLVDEQMEKQLAAEAWAMTDNGAANVRVLIYCNSRDTASKTKEAIVKLTKQADVPEENVQLFVGARRVKERNDTKNALASLGFFSNNPAPEKPAFVVATSAGEVGVDLDADHIAMDLVAFERMIQRLGRVNRLGEKDSTIVAVYGEKPVPKNKSTPTEEEKRSSIAWEAFNLLQHELPCHEDGSRDACPGSLMSLKEKHSKTVKSATTLEPLYPPLTRALVDAWSMTSLKEHAGRPEIGPWLRGWVSDEPRTTLVWRKHLPVRPTDRGGPATKKEVDDFFSNAPPHLAEMLETETYQVHDWLRKRLSRLMAVARKQCDGELHKTPENGWPTESAVVAFLLGRANDSTRNYTLYDLNRALADKRTFERAVAGMTLVLDARLGGLSKNGLLDAADTSPISAADAQDGWMEPDEGAIDQKRPLVPVRVRRVTRTKDSAADTERDGAAERESLEQEPTNQWYQIHSFSEKQNQEGDVIIELVVEVWAEEKTSEDSLSLTPKRAQKLEQHQSWAEEKARKLVQSLGLKGELGKAVILASSLHDEGKRAQRWQRAFSAKTEGIYAKTKGPFRRALLGGYRHEFGSLGYLERNTEFSELSDEVKDLVLHLVAAHHGRARPVIETDGAEGPPSILEARARDVAVRFAKLQRRFGPWGLAWLEALVRAADQQASRDLDKGRALDG